MMIYVYILIHEWWTQLEQRHRLIENTTLINRSDDVYCCYAFQFLAPVLSTAYCDVNKIDQ